MIGIIAGLEAGLVATDINHPLLPSRWHSATQAHTVLFLLPLSSSGVQRSTPRRIDALLYFVYYIYILCTPTCQNAVNNSLESPVKIYLLRCDVTYLWGERGDGLDDESELYIDNVLHDRPSSLPDVGKVKNFPWEP